jgi:hypothetical protein
MLHYDFWYAMLHHIKIMRKSIIQKENDELTSDSDVLRMTVSLRGKAKDLFLQRKERELHSYDGTFAAILITRELLRGENENASAE